MQACHSRAHYFTVYHSQGCKVTFRTKVYTARRRVPQASFAASDPRSLWVTRAHALLMKHNGAWRYDSQRFLRAILIILLRVGTYLSWQLEVCLVARVLALVEMDAIDRVDWHAVICANRDTPDSGWPRKYAHSVHSMVDSYTCFQQLSRCEFLNFCVSHILSSLWF